MIALGFLKSSVCLRRDEIGVVMVLTIIIGMSALRSTECNKSGWPVGRDEDGSVDGGANSVIRTGREKPRNQLEGVRRIRPSFDEDDPYLSQQL